jgi:hypothetical protein
MKSSIVLSAVAICFFAGAASASSLQNAQALKSQVVSEETALNQLVAEIQDTEKQIETLSDGRGFFSRKSQAEKDLIKANKENAKKVKELEEEIELSLERLRAVAKDALTESDRDYAGTRELVRQLEPVLANGKSVVSQLKSARSLLSSSQFSSGLNATTAALKSLDNQKPDALDAFAQLTAQAAASRALKAGQNALRAAGQFNDQLSEVASANHDLLGGSWNAAVNRGMIYYIVTAGRNPLSSNGFNLSTSLFQLSDLSAIKAEVQKALKIVEPTVNQMNSELSGLLQNMKQAEDRLIESL